MIITYKTTMEEAIDCHVRLWWLSKSSSRQIVVNLLFIPVICIFLAYQSNYKLIETSLRCFLFIIIYGGYLVYAYGPGYRKKIRKRLLESLDGKPFPDEVEYKINEEGINTNNGLYEIKIKWKSINEIRPYKQYVEFVGMGSLIQIRNEYVPSIEEIIAIWKNNR